MAKTSATKRDQLNPEEIAEFIDAKSDKPKKLYERGKPYVWVLGFGWCIVGFYLGHENAITIRVAHANHFKSAGKDYGLLMTEGGGPDTEWRYEGNCELGLGSILRACEYHGQVPRQRVGTR